MPHQSLTTVIPALTAAQRQSVEVIEDGQTAPIRIPPNESKPQEHLISRNTETGYWVLDTRQYETNWQSHYNNEDLVFFQVPDHLIADAGSITWSYDSFRGGILTATELAVGRRTNQTALMEHVGSLRPPISILNEYKLANSRDNENTFVDRTKLQAALLFDWARTAILYELFKEAPHTYVDDNTARDLIELAFEEGLEKIFDFSGNILGEATPKHGGFLRGYEDFVNKLVVAIQNTRTAAVSSRVRHLQGGYFLLGTSRSSNSGSTLTRFREAMRAVTTTT